MYRLRYHGNYVGPGWSAGKYQDSVADSDVPAVDEFDETAKEHDAAYARGQNLKAADYKFYRVNFGKGFKRSLAAAAVGLQGYLRSDDSSSSNAPMAPLVRKRKYQAPPTPGTGRRNPRNVRRRTVVSSVSIPVRRRQFQRPQKKRMMRSKLLRRKKYRRGPPRRRGSVLTSISSGFFSKGTSYKKKLEYYAKYGVVVAAEKGERVVGSLAGAGPPATYTTNSVMIGHANYSKEELIQCASFAITKMLATKLNRMFVTLQEPITTSYGSRVTISYKNSITGNLLNHVQVFASTAKWQDVANQLKVWMQSYDSDETIWLKIVYEHALNSTNTQWYPDLTLDATKMRFQFYNKSALKIQNSTRGESVEADAVDNIPLYGKSYEGSGNYVVYHNDNDGGDAQIMVFRHNQNAPLYTRRFGQGEPQVGALIEPPPKNVFRRVSKDGKAHLDPGSIKTSILEHSLNISVYQFLKTIQGAGILAGPQLNINKGKFRFFILEKMIQSINTIGANSITVNVELDSKTGCVCSCPKVTPTNLYVNQVPE